jgi:cytoskeletal protein RodZ
MMGHIVETSFGGDLRQVREQQGLSIQALSDATKVPAKHIRALEAGDFGELPGGVFRRGFVRSYVEALGLEEKKWMKRFDEVCRTNGIAGASSSDWIQFAENVKNNRAVSPPTRAARGAGLGLLVITLAAAGWCGWRLLTHRGLFPAPLAGIYSNSSVDKASFR